MLDTPNYPHPNPSHRRCLPEGEGNRSHSLLILAALALFITVLNALKPIEVDDAVFIQNAAQIARHPLDPYGFTVFWFQWPEPAIWELCPPVLPYWIALGMKLLGPSPLLWKLWLLPWIGTFVFSLHALFRRFCPGVELPLTILTALSPEFLPGINLMFDLPALTLSLVALNLLLLAAADTTRCRWTLALLSGGFAGLAMQTKFTALSVPLVLFTYAALKKRWGVGAIAAAVAVAIFVGWELFDWRRYGVSHFLFNLRANDIIKGVSDPVGELGSIVTLLGGVAGVVAAVGLLGMGAPLWLVAAMIGAIVAGVALVGFWSIAFGVFVAVGVAVCLVFAAAVAQLFRRHGSADVPERHFLLLWLLIETAACAGISPFPAARRVMGVVLVLTVISGTLLARRPVARRGPLWVVVGFSVAFGLLFEMLDAHDAFAQRDAVAAAAQVIQATRRPGQTVWFTGRWGIDHYAKQLGYLPVVPDQSRLHRGDWVVAARQGVVKQNTGFAASVVNLVQRVTVVDRVPFSFLPFYYGGQYPLQHLQGPRLSLTVYQVTRDFIPLSTIPPATIIAWALQRHEPLPAASVPAVLRAAAAVNSDKGRLALHAVAQSGVDALLMALRDPSASARRWAAEALQSDPAAVQNPLAINSLQRRATADPDPSVRSAAASAVHDLEARPARQ